MDARDVFKYTVLGGISGVTSTYFMTKFQNSAGRLEAAVGKDNQDGQGKEEKQAPSTVKLANKLSQLTVQHKIPREDQEIAGNIVHYGFGTSVGAFYGLLNFFLPRRKLTSGVLYGIAVWVVADNILVPLMGLSRGPLRKSLKTQAYALTSHLVYGGALSTLFKREAELVEGKL